MLKFRRSKRKSGERQPNTEKKQHTFLAIPVSLKHFKRRSNSEKDAENQGNPTRSTDTRSLELFDNIFDDKKTNSESLTYEVAKYPATKSQKSRKPPFTRSLIKRKQPVDYEISITKSMRMTGFYNLRNSCYFKSVLQNLLLLHPFREHLICTITRTEYRLVLEKYPHFNTFINSNKKGKPRKLIRATTFQSKATKGTFNRNISRQNECQLRIVECKYCSATIHYTLLKYHNKICPEFRLVCPNECLKSLFRKELKSHIEKECPNTLIACPYKEMGCEALIKRSELSEHEKPFESKRFDKTEEFYLEKVKKLESIIQEKEDEIKRLTAENQKRQKQPKTNNISVIGLSNLGNTCYLNSVLQNLLYLRPFRELLSYTMTRIKYKLVPKKHPELETIEFASDKKAEPGQLTKELFNLIQETNYQPEATERTFGKKARNKNTQKIVKPKAVQIEIAKKYEKFSDCSQQDSYELFRILIEIVKDEEIKRLKIAFEKHFNIKDNKTQSMNCSVNRKNLKKYASEFENIFVFTGTFIDDTFGGKMLSTVKCEGCGRILNINKDFLDISLPLPEYSQEHNILSFNQPQSGIESNSEEEVNVKSREVKRLNRMPNDYPKDSLEYYLMRFFSPIFLEEDYVCNNCNPQLVSNQDETSDTGSDENDDTDSIDYDALIFTSAVKQFHIKTVGPVLTIHLKRFSQTGHGLQKLNKRVEFPLELDMSPFCVSDTSVPKDCNNKILYGLRGIVDHSGGMFGGHYVAHVNIADWNVKISFARENGTCKSPYSNRKSALPEEWYTISDSHISNTNHDRVFSSQAYILFYERLPL